MRRFFKRILRKIGYKFIRILMPCIIVLSLILSCGISASAEGVSVSASTIMNNATLNGDTYMLPDGRIMSHLPVQDVDLDFYFDNQAFYTEINELITVTFDYYSGFWVVDRTGNYGNAYVRSVAVKGYDENGILRSFQIDTDNSTLIEPGDTRGTLTFSFRSLYTLSRIQSVTIIFYFPGGNYGSLWDSAAAQVSFGLTSNFNWFVGKSYTGADDSNYNLYENVESELLESQKNYLKEGADFISGLQGLPTQGMQNGLAVISQFMTRFLAISEFGSIYRISLALGFFAFIVGMSIWAVSKFGKSDKGGKGK